MYEFQSGVNPEHATEEEDEPMFCPFLKANCNDNCALLNEEEDGTASCALSDIAESLDEFAKKSRL